jgi:hypothetical protein
MKMPTLNEHDLSDEQLYKVDTKEHGILFCTTYLAYNEDGVTISTGNDVVFKSVDPLSRHEENYKENNIYAAHEINSWELIERKM